jgi:transcriptional regulator with XRE-family HTH domain
MEKSQQNDPEARMAAVLLRYLHGWDQAEMARAARIAPSQVSIYDRGGRALPREVLERMAEAAGFPTCLLDPLLRGLRSFRAAARGRSREEAVLEERLVSELIGIGGAAVAAVLAAFESEVAKDAVRDRPPRSTDREEAAVLWGRLARRNAAQRKALVEETEEFRGWALCERVAAESLAAAASDPRQALELAGLACRIADLASGSEAWRRRLQGYAWAHLSHARRACDDLPGAAEARERAAELWSSGGGPDLLKEAGLPGLDAA